MRVRQPDLADADARAIGSGKKGCASQRGSSAENKITASHERVMDAKVRDEEVKALGEEHFYLLSRQ
jgi:hypothetical protein